MSVASWGRRLVAVAVDWLLAMMFVGAFVGPEIWSGGGVAQWGPLMVFALEYWVLTSTLGGSAGQLLLAIRVVRTDGSRIGAVRVLVRTALLCLVLPAVIFNQDRQGLHDVASDSIVVLR
jgi:uncharacterized RDD family membrane protein YckC